MAGARDQIRATC